MEGALEALGRLDRLLRATLAGLPRELSLVVASDHGNVEDLGSRNHTTAPVPVLGFGPAASRIDEVRDLTHIAPLLLTLALPGALSAPPSEG
jgi:2,3-bisphosphoglycerate-independent phosphoglycerate mutase